MFRSSEKVGLEKSLLAYGIRAYATLMRDRFDENAFKTKDEHFDQLIALVQVFLIKHHPFFIYFWTLC